MKQINTLKNSKFIWADEVQKNSYVGFRKKFIISDVPVNAHITIFADTHYKLYINGKFVNAGPAPFRKPVIYADTYNITPYLKKGRNTVFVFAHFIGKSVKYNISANPELIALISINMKNKKKINIPTDDTWEYINIDAWIKETPEINWALGFVEEIDMKKFSYKILSEYALEDYFVQKYPLNKIRFKKVSVLPDKKYIIRSRITPNLKWTNITDLQVLNIFKTNTEIYDMNNNGLKADTEYLEPLYDIEKYNILKSGYIELNRRNGEHGVSILYDIKRISAGDINITIETDSECTVDIFFAETMHDWRPYLAPGYTKYFIRLHLKKGINKYRTYHFSGFRYIYIVSKNFIGNFKISSLSIQECYADFNYEERLETSDRLLKNIYDISFQSIKLNNQANIYDCNTREKGTYWGDAIWVADMTGHLTGNFSYMKNLCYGITEEFTALNKIQGNLYGIGDLLYDYSLVSAKLLKTYFEYTNDEKTVKDNISTVEKIIDSFRILKDKTGLIYLGKRRIIPPDTKGEGILFLDHPGNSWHPQLTTPIVREDYNSGINLFYLQALISLQFLYSSLNYKKSVKSEIEFLRKKIYNYFYIKNIGLIADSKNKKIKRFSFSQISNALAITTEVLTNKDALFAINKITKIKQNPYISQGTPYTYFFLSEAWAKLKQIKLGLSAIKQNWEPMLRRGATTTWETFNGDITDSLNHSWSAPLPYFLYRGAAGISPLKPGYKKIRIFPDFSAFDNFFYQIKIPSGKISIKWKEIKPFTYELNLTIPKNTIGVFSYNDLNINFSKNKKLKIIV